MGALKPYQIGRLSIHHISIQAAFGIRHPDGSDSLVEKIYGNNQVRGLLTRWVSRTLCNSNRINWSYSDLLHDCERNLGWLCPYMVGENLKERTFTNVLKEAEVSDVIRGRVHQNPARQAVTLLRLAIDQQHSVDPDAHLELGVAYAALNDFDNSIPALQTAIEQKGDKDFPEAHYQIGKVLYLSKRDVDRAISELRRARNLDPDNAEILYYLGHAIRERVAREEEVLVEAEEAFKDYLSRGAPLGKRETVAAFLQSRRQKPIQVAR